MSESFNLKQLLNFALSRERESWVLYNALAKKSTIPKLKSLFKKLAIQELEHEQFYTNLIKKYSLDDDLEYEENEYTVYMRNIMEEHAASFDVTSQHIYSISQALDYAIAREKHSILFYSGLKNYIPKDARPALDLIIKEEMRHASILMNVKLKKNIEKLD